MTKTTLQTVIGCTPVNSDASIYRGYQNIDIFRYMESYRIGRLNMDYFLYIITLNLCFQRSILANVNAS